MPTPEQLLAIMQPKFGLFDSTELGLDAWHYWENFKEKYHKDSKKAFPGNVKHFSRINMETRATLGDLLKTISLVYWRAVKLRNSGAARSLISAFFAHFTENRHSKDCVFFFKDGMKHCPCAENPLWSVSNSILEPDERGFFHNKLNQIWMDMPALSFGALTSPVESVFDTISNDISKNREKTYQFGAGFYN